VFDIVDARYKDEVLMHIIQSSPEQEYLVRKLVPIVLATLTNTVLFISPSGISELDCATTKTDTAERSMSIGRESLQVSFFLY